MRVHTSMALLTGLSILNPDCLDKQIADAEAKTEEVQGLIRGKDIEAQGMDGITMHLIYGMNRFFYSNQSDDFPKARIEECRAAITAYRTKLKGSISAWYSEGPITRSRGILGDLEERYVGDRPPQSTGTMDIGMWSDETTPDTLASLMESIQNGYEALGQQVDRRASTAYFTRAAILKQREHLTAQLGERAQAAYHNSLEQAQAFFASHPDLPKGFLVTLDSTYEDVPVGGHPSLGHYISFKDEHPAAVTYSCLSAEQRDARKDNIRSRQYESFSYASEHLQPNLSPRKQWQ